MENFGKFMAIVLSLILSPIVNGFVFTKLWGWFIVTTFNANPLRIVEAIGIMYLLSFVGARNNKYKTDEFWSDFGERVIFVLLYAGVILFSGWIVHSLM